MRNAGDFLPKFLGPVVVRSMIDRSLIKLIIESHIITKKMRTAGSLKACLSTEGISDEEAVKKARDSDSIVGQDYVKEVSCSEPFFFDQGGEQSIPFTVTGTNLKDAVTPKDTHRLVAFDFGAKKAIFKNLRQNGFEVIVLPAVASVEQVKSHSPDAIFLSNGPGDPSALSYAHETIRVLLNEYPIFWKI